MVARDEFEQAVAEALAYYSDSSRLALSKLPAWLLPPTPAPESRIMGLRQLLRESIETLRPPTSLPLSEPGWLDYQLLWSRFIQRRSVVQICAELSLSRSAFYRHQRRAASAVARILWDRFRGTLPAQPSESPQAALSEASTAVEAAGRLASEAKRIVVDTQELLHDVRRTLDTFLTEQHLELRVTRPPRLPPTYGDPTVLRQILLCLVTGAARVGVKGAILLDVAEDGNDIRFMLRGFEAIPDTAALTEGADFAISQRLLAIYGGRMSWQREGGSPLLVATIPIDRPRVILIVDDDESAAGLYERLLSSQGYECLVAHGGDDAWGILEDTTPDLIILDVLMPKEDGWLVLQRLKTLPETAPIPVIVCSILGQPSLALSLGAYRVLSKPVQVDRLVAAVSDAVAPPGSRA